MASVTLTVSTLLAFPAAWTAGGIEVAVGISSSGGSWSGLRAAMRIERRKAAQSEPAAPDVLEIPGSVRGALISLLAMDAVGAALVIAVLVGLQPSRLASLFGGSGTWAVWLLLGFATPTGGAFGFVYGKIASLFQSGRNAEISQRARTLEAASLRLRLRNTIAYKVYVVTSERERHLRDELVRIELPIRTGVISSEELTASAKRFFEMSTSTVPRAIRTAITAGKDLPVDGCVELLFEMIEVRAYVPLLFYRRLVPPLDSGLLPQDGTPPRFDEQG